MGKQYQEGDTAYITIRHKTYDFDTEVWSLADPDNTFPKITIIDSAGVTKVDAVTMSSIVTGKWEYLYTLPASPATGWWKGWVDVKNGNYPDREWFGFLVE